MQATLFEPPELETGRLVLAPFADGDESLVPTLYRDDPEVTRFVGWKPLVDPERARRFVEVEARAWADEDACRGLLARERAGGAAVGALIVRRHPAGAEFSYVIDKSRWGEGLATEIVAALLARAREDAGLEEIWAVCDVDNIASARVLEKAGLRYDRLLPGHARHRGFEDRRDCLRFTARLRDETGS
jgi:RimJ/RimL family protein N-acetyltransferase